MFGKYFQAKNFSYTQEKPQIMEHRLQVQKIFKLYNNNNNNKPETIYLIKLIQYSS